ncbi:MAG: ubiquinol-cytochrome C chaperone [Proteobacteria bacterium]|nr:ubiquinol-cytochrome C chaperone [Pseudomonadota bacterium]
MFAFLTKPRINPEPLFEAALAASRNPVFYRDLAVPDSFDGRFDALLFHLWPVFRAIEADDRLSQRLYDLTFKRMELALRETGVGDLGVAKQVRAMMKAFYGRLSTYTACQSLDEWRDALRRNLYGTVADEAFIVPDAMIVYAQNLAGMRVSLDEARGGRFIFPQP